MLLQENWPSMHIGGAGSTEVITQKAKDVLDKVKLLIAILLITILRFFSLVSRYVI